MSNPAELRTLTLFNDCTAQELDLAARLLTTVDAGPGRTLMVQGDPARQFVIVAEGQVEVIHQAHDDSTLTVSIGADQYVGEVGLLDGVPCTATVRTIGPARVHVCGPREFRSLVDILPVACELRTIADDRLAQNELADA